MKNEICVYMSAGTLINYLPIIISTQRRSDHHFCEDVKASEPGMKNLDVGDWGQGLLAVGVLGGEGQQRGHTQRHAGRHRLGLDPEAEHHHYDHQPHYYHHHQYHLIQDIMTMRQVGM